jgi:hypothetical protein
MYKIKNVVHLIFVINFSTSFFINFFVYILQIIQKLNHKQEFNVQPQIPTDPPRKYATKTTNNSCILRKILAM